MSGLVPRKVPNQLPGGVFSLKSPHEQKLKSEYIAQVGDMAPADMGASVRILQRRPHPEKGKSQNPQS